MRAGLSLSIVSDDDSTGDDSSLGDHDCSVNDADRNPKSETREFIFLRYL